MLALPPSITAQTVGWDSIGFNFDFQPFDLTLHLGYSVSITLTQRRGRNGWLLEATVPEVHGHDLTTKKKVRFRLYLVHRFSHHVWSSQNFVL